MTMIKNQKQDWEKDTIERMVKESENDKILLFHQKVGNNFKIGRDDTSEPVIVCTMKNMEDKKQQKDNTVESV